MGFPSPAVDYVERTLSPAVICSATDDSCILETDADFSVIKPVVKMSKGDALLIMSDSHTQFAKLMGSSLITDDGEAIEGSRWNRSRCSGE